MDRTGALYGTTEEGGLGYGTVFRLAPPQHGKAQWTETVLYRFTGGADGAMPEGGLSIDRNGILYGSNILGGAGCGTVFELTPPAAGQTAWTYGVLHSFTGGQTDGCQPIATPMLTRSGTLYGTTYVGGSQNGGGSGVVYQLSPPVSGQTSWTEAVLWHFGGLRDGALPHGSVVVGPHGVLYGTTLEGGVNAKGTLFRLVPPTKNHPEWKESAPTFHRNIGIFPWAGLAVDPAGHLYGTTSLGGAHDGGTVFEITP
jgi:uncharacterized repeat protein (TIGR03803 family)